MKLLIIILMMSFGYILNAQEVNFNGNIYTVKGKNILKEGVDVTSTLTIDEKQQIITAFDKKKLQELIEKKDISAKEALSEGIIRAEEWFYDLEG